MVTEPRVNLLMSMCAILCHFEVAGMKLVTQMLQKHKVNVLAELHCFCLDCLLMLKESYFLNIFVILKCMNIFEYGSVRLLNSQR